MKDKLKNNKGMSLVEILVSMAIVGIMIIPISGMVNTAIKTNKKSEVRQQATLLGQQILEELEWIPEITKGSISLSGGNIDGQIDNTDVKSIYETNDYKKENDKYGVRIELEENKDVRYDTQEGSQDESILEIKDKIDLKANENSNSIEINKDGINQTISIDDKTNANMNIEFVLDNGVKKLKINDSANNLQTHIMQDNKLILNFTKEYKLKEGLTITVFNNLNEPINLYIQKSYDCEEKIYVENNFGELNINNIRDNAETKNRQMQRLYNVKVDIFKDGKKLFTTYGNKNIKIKD